MMPALPTPETMAASTKLAPAQVQGLAAHDARHVEPVDRTDGEKDEQDVAAEEHRQQDHEEHEGQRVQHIHRAHHQRIQAPPT